jgi:hypothetical protein
MAIPLRKGLLLVSEGFAERGDLKLGLHGARNLKL